MKRNGTGKRSFQAHSTTDTGPLPVVRRTYDATSTLGTAPHRGDYRVTGYLYLPLMHHGPMLPDTKTRLHPLYHTSA